MKRITLLFIASFFCIAAKAQLTLDQTFSGQRTLVQPVVFSANGTKYWGIDTGSSSVKLYNTDYSLWKTINVTAPDGYVFQGAGELSDNLFNSDDKVELIAGFSSTATGTTTYRMLLINEDGTTLQDLDSALASSVYRVEGNYKLATYQINNLSLYTSTTRIYSLPGTLPCIECSSTSGAGKLTGAKTNTPVVVPNPSSDAAKVYYQLPAGTSTGMLTITDVNGKLAKTYTVDGVMPYITISNHDVAAGTYYCRLLANGAATGATQMVIVK